MSKSPTRAASPNGPPPEPKERPELEDPEREEIEDAVSEALEHDEAHVPDEALDRD